MGVSVFLSLMKDAFFMAFLLAAPILIASLVVGVVISIFQAATSISDSTLNFAPKVAVAGVVMLIALPWMLSKLIAFFQSLFLNLNNFIR